MFKGPRHRNFQSVRSESRATGTASLLHVVLLVKQSQAPPSIKGKGHRLYLSGEECQRLRGLFALPATDENLDRDAADLLSFWIYRMEDTLPAGKCIGTNM